MGQTAELDIRLRAIPPIARKKAMDGAPGRKGKGEISNEPDRG